MLVHADLVSWFETKFCVTKESPHDEDKKTRSKALGLQGPLIYGGLHVIVTLMVLSSSGRERQVGKMELSIVTIT
jgi:hypothetical protein